MREEIRAKVVNSRICRTLARGPWSFVLDKHAPRPTTPIQLKRKQFLEKPKPALKTS